MEDITRRFFNIHEPCPTEVPNCSELRDEYSKTLDSLKVRGCAPCAESNLKNKFISKLKEILVATQ